jgi:transposase
MQTHEQLNEDWVSRHLGLMGFSLKDIQHKHIAKLTVANIIYYAHYTSAVIFIPRLRLKFADEAHFNSLGMHCMHCFYVFLFVSCFHGMCASFCTECQRVKGFSELGRRLSVFNRQGTDDWRYSITITTDLTLPDGVYISNPRVSSNTAVDFLLYVIELLQAGVLVAGDYFIVDNASIHVAAEISNILSLLLDLHQVRLVTLPTYSSELNPCELCFAQAKRYIRTHRHDGPFLAEIALGFAQIKRENVMAYYGKCIDEWFEQ